MLSVTSFELQKIRQRLDVLEEAVFKKPKRKRATKAQRILMMKHLGLLEIIEDLNLQQNHKAILISIFLDVDPENVEKDLSQVHKKVSNLKTESNLQFLRELYQDLALKNPLKLVEADLKSLPAANK